MTEAELAALVSQHLTERGIKVVLSGGTCVTIYADRAYVSGDLDFVQETFVRMSTVASALAEIGFVRAARVFKHADALLVVDVRPPPLSVGAEPVKRIAQMTLPTGTLRLLSATDCVKDRLAGYYYFDDRQCLEQARLVVAHAADVDLAEVERWSKSEGQQQKFSAIQSLLQQSRPGRAP
ncbi:MAG TPA: hypothetical protein VM431_04260 [Phycisphaerae bacterium]|nr:hypothetical protein [Phycisphaerae bacterium]